MNGTARLHAPGTGRSGKVGMDGLAAAKEPGGESGRRSVEAAS